MKTTILLRLALSISLIVISTLSSFGELTMEQLQRDYQVRYHLLTGGWLQWPKCSAGETAAPHFPKDGFYGDLSQNPDKAVEVVSNLVQEFYTNHCIYTNFVKTANGFDGLEGVSNIVNFAEGDLQPLFSPVNITADNVAASLASVATHISELSSLKVQATQVITNDDTKETYSPSLVGNDDSIGSCADVKNCVANNYLSTPWGSFYYCPYDPDIPGCDGPYGSSSDSFTNISVVCESNAADPNSNYGQPYSYVRNTRGRIVADLTQFKNGTVAVFLKLTAVPCSHGYLNVGNPAHCGGTTFTNFSQVLPSSAGESKYGRWSSGVLMIGTNYPSGYVTEAFPPPPPIGDCPFVFNQIYGWEVADAAAIVAPDFTTIPDDLDCCSACAGSAKCEIGTPGFALKSIHMSVPLGRDLFGSSVGAIMLDADTPSTNLAAPSALRYVAAANTYFVSNSTGPLAHLQFKTSQSLADIQTNNAFKYTMSFYTAADAGSTNGAGFYQPTGSPFRTVVIENPDTTNAYTHLKITTDDGNTIVTDYLYNTNTLSWEMDTGNGLRKETRVSTWLGGTNRTETVTVTNASNQLVYKELNFYRLFAWGQERLTNVVDPDGAKLTNTWVFYSDPTNDGGAYRQLKMEIDANGRWTSYQYDQNGRETNRISQFLNSAVGSAADSNRVTITTYSTNAPQITIIEKLLGKETSKRYQIITSGEVKDIQCQTGGALITASDNLTNITTKYTNGSFAGQVKRVKNANGTVQVYLYSTNSTQKTTVLLSGVPDSGSDTNIVSGTITTTVTMLDGQTLTNSVTYRQPGASDVLIDRDFYTYLDARNRSYQVTHFDGTTEQFNYACCGLDSQVDRDGTSTYFTYDDLKRQIKSARNGITNTTALDPNGAVLSTIRRGTDGTQITNRQAVYDVAGRLKYETNALGGPTLYTNYFDASHQLVRQTTYPDLGTRIETYFQDGSLQSVSGTAVFPVRYEYGVESDGSGSTNAFTKEIKLTSTGGTNEWTKTYTDAVGRSYKTVYAASSSPPYAISYFNNIGQITNTVDQDGVSTLFAFNEKGEPALTVLDSNRNYTIDFSGNDRITFVTNDVVSAHSSVTVRRSRTYVWSTSGSSSNLISMTETSVDGLQTWQTIYADPSTPVTSQSSTAYAGSGYHYITNIAPDGSYSLIISRYGTNISITQFDSSSSSLSSVSYLYDGHGRLNRTTDARNGTTTNWFNNADQISSTKTPVPATGQSAQVTTNFFDKMGRVIATKLPDNTYVTNKFDVTGLLTNTFGSRAYPVSYTYDAQGRMKTMKTWKNYSGNSGAATTTWNYDQYRGFLTSKTYDGNAAGPSYTYTAAGRLASRLWARGTNTTYTYNNAGDPSGVAYSDTNTASLSYGYDRRGRQTTITNGTAVCSLIVSDAGALLSESNSGGALDGISVTNGYDQFLRRTNLAVLSSSVPLFQHSYSFDSASRLRSVFDGTNSASYSYVANSPLVGQIAFTNSGAQRMLTAKTYDLLNRMTNVSSVPSTSSAVSSRYQYNTANQRTQRTDADNSYWVYSYDSLGQVISGKRHWSDNAPVAGEQYEYAFDDIGNRASTRSGGDQYNGSYLRSANYANNSLNQITSRDVPGYLNIVGTANSNATVSLWTTNGLWAQASRHGEYYRGELAVNNSTGALYLTITNLAVLPNGTNADIMTNSIGNAFVPLTPESFTYDGDGNLTSDGGFTNLWDAENRVRGFGIRTNKPGPAPGIVSGYDYLGRRISKIVLNLRTGIGPITTKYVYDGWNLVAVLDNTSSLLYSFAWGTDLSGTAQGAGGVGGLLSMTVHSGANAGTYFYAYDGNGNVSALVNSTNGVVAAQYEYGPFGELIRASGPMAFTNPFRFSTKFQDDETGFLYYGYRYYNPSTGRWLSRDVIEEGGGVNLYGLVGNDSLDYVDTLGLEGLVLQYDLAPDGIAPFGVKKVSGVSALLADAKSRVGKCDCIKLLRIGAHGYPGSINDNTTPGLNITGNTFGNYERALQNPRLLSIPAVQQDVQVVEALQSLSGLMCKNRQVEFISCNSFACERGRDLHGDLEGIFGEGNVKGYAYPVKWGLFGTVYWITETKGDTITQKVPVPGHP